MNFLEQLSREYSLTQREVIHFLIACAFFLSAALLVIILLLNRLIKSRITKITARANQTLTQLVQQMILENDHDHSSVVSEVEFQKLVSYTKRRYYRQVLIDVLLHHRKNFIGIYARRLEQLYAQLDLVQLSLRKVNSRKWHLQIKGLREIAAMRYVSVHEQIAQKLYSSNPIVRDECRLALMKLIDYDPLFFLDTIHEPLTRWMQIHILDYFDKSPQATRPDFTRWFTHGEVSVVCFAISMSAYFMQQQAKLQFKQLLNHPDRSVITETVRAIGLTEAFEFADTIIALPSEYFHHKALSLAALTTLGKIGSSDEHLHFIHTFLTSPDQEIQMSAAFALRKFGDRGVEQLNASNDPALQKIALHTGEPLLQM